MDHADLYVTNERNSLTSKMLEGIPHSLLLSNMQREIQVYLQHLPCPMPTRGIDVLGPQSWKTG